MSLNRREFVSSFPVVGLRRFHHMDSIFRCDLHNFFSSFPFIFNKENYLQKIEIADLPLLRDEIEVD